VLKKAGIIVATAAAGLLAVSPLAFAGDHHDGHGKTKVEDVNAINGSNHGGLVNLAGNNLSVPVNACDNQVPVNVLGVQVPLNDTHVLARLTGAIGLLGSDTDADSDGDNTIDDSCNAAATTGDSAEIDD
jgi:hypothetical protein